MEKRWWAMGIGCILGGSWWGLAGYWLGRAWERHDPSAGDLHELILANLMGFNGHLLAACGSPTADSLKLSAALWVQELQLSAVEQTLIVRYLERFGKAQLNLESMSDSFLQRVAGGKRKRFWRIYARLAAVLNLQRDLAAPWLMTIAKQWRLTGDGAAPQAAATVMDGLEDPTLLAHAYQTLNVPFNANWMQIKASYYDLAKRYHPDLSLGSANGNPGLYNHQGMVRINNAYEMLRRWFGH